MPVTVCMCAGPVCVTHIHVFCVVKSTYEFHLDDMCSGGEHISSTLEFLSSRVDDMCSPLNTYHPHVDDRNSRVDDRNSMVDDRNSRVTGIPVTHIFFLKKFKTSLFLCF